MRLPASLPNTKGPCNLVQRPVTPAWMTSDSVYVFQNTPYVAYQDESGAVCVDVYGQTTGWGPVGNSLGNPASPTSVSLFMDGGTPYVAYQDSSNDVCVDVYSQANGWKPVGPDAGTGMQDTAISLSMYQGTPYVAYQNDTNSNITVSKYDNGGWTQSVGSPPDEPLQWGSSISLYVDQDTGTPYVAYQTYQEPGCPIVVYSYGSGWQEVGGALDSSGGPTDLSLSMSGDTPYVAYQYTGSADPPGPPLGAVEVDVYGQAIGWQPVGPSPGTGFDGYGGSSISLFVDGDTPYVAYQDSTKAVCADVYDQTSGWLPEGGGNVGTAPSGSTVSFFVDPGTPYVGYWDASKKDCLSVKSVPYTVTVSASPQAGGTASIYGGTNPGSYFAGASVTVYATPAGGWAFNYWTEDGNTVSGAAYKYSFTMPAHDVDFTAYFKQQQAQTYNVNVTVSPQGSGTVTGGGQYASGKNVTLTATPESGWAFNHWTEDGNTVSGAAYKYSFTMPARDVDFTACFNANNNNSNSNTGPTAPSQAAVTVAPPVTNLPAGAILDRSIGAVFAGPSGQASGTVEGTTYQNGAPAAIVIPITTQPPGPDYTIEIYHWQLLPLPGTKLPGRWVALATTMQNGRAVAVNDGHYSGWFAAWWVIKPHFTDIAGSWAVNDIRRLDGLGIVEGYPGAGLNRPFRPNRPISRTELTVIAARIMGLNPGTHAYAYLQPVSYDQAVAILKKSYADWRTIPVWARTYVAAMTRAGYVQGMDGCFDGALPMPRIQAGVLVSNILRAIGYTTPADVTRFADAGSIPLWARGRLVSGVLYGSGGLLRPNDTITRAGECTVLLRLFRTLGW